jgi:transketolase
MTYEDLLLQFARQDERLVVLTAENRVAIRGLPPKLGGRFIDVGIAEQTMVGAAAGLALRGRIPVVHALATFLTLRAFEFARTDVGIGNLPVKLVGGVPGFLSDANGPTHQAVEDIALMRGIPGMNVFCPADAEELVEGMALVLEHPSPWYVRYNALPAAVKHPAPFAVGKAEELVAGRDVTVLSFGFLVREASAAVRLLGGRGVSVRLLNLRTLKPIDEEAILAAAAETRLLVTVEDHFQTGGLTSIVAEVLMRHRESARVLPIALPDRWFKPALLPAVLEFEGFTGARIAERIAEAL